MASDGENLQARSQTVTNVWIDLAAFLRSYPLRATNIMWFLGAGASAAAGVPTAEEMVWDFKRSLYCSALRVPLPACSDLGDPRLRSILQKHFDQTGGFPPRASTEEYAGFFEAAYPDAADRRRYIDAQISVAQPSYGHLALAALLKVDRTRLIWTVNFDRTIEDAAARTFGTTTKFTVGTPDNPEIARQAVEEGRWPVIAKLHGDFQSRRLKNTAAELQQQDEQLRRLLVDCCARYGLAVIGYSGRDCSVMDALSEALERQSPYPFGIFWFCKSGEIRPEVAAFIERAIARKVAAHCIEIETFDEALADIFGQMPEVPQEVSDALRSVRRRISDAAVPKPATGWPVLRTNAVPILALPSVCRRVVCEIGGAAEVQKLIDESGAPIVAARRKAGVLAFGEDADIRALFEQFKISEFDLYSIEVRRLAYDSAERGLLLDALVRAICKHRPLKAERKGSTLFLTVPPEQASEKALATLRGLTQSLGGTVPNTELEWREAARVKIERRLSRTWLLILPTVWVEEATDAGDDDDSNTNNVRAEFVRERTATRYNRIWNGILDAWTSLISGCANECELRTFGVTNGVDAVFSISRLTAFSRG